MKLNRAGNPTPTREYQKHSIRRRTAYTLLELMLALGLAVLVLASIAVSIHVYLLTLTQQQSYIEQQQIARSVLAMVGNDLRAALQYKAADVSGLEDLAVSQALIAGLLGGTNSANSSSQGGDGTATGDEAENALDGGAGGGDTTGTGSNGGNSNTDGGTGGGTGGENASGGESAGWQESSTGEDTAVYRPLMIGAANQLTIDVSRLPRIDQYNTFLLGLDPQSARPSDLKSVSYFLSASPPVDPAAEFDPAVSRIGGLYRRQIDRAVANYRGEDAAPSMPDEYCKLVAPEVVGLEFRYYDGSDWTSSWDSEELQHFPLAIEVVVTIDPDRIKNSGSGSTDLGAQLSGLRQYRSVVHLPAAEAPPSEEESAQ